jgi:hypothetical protein
LTSFSTAEPFQLVSASRRVTDIRSRDAGPGTGNAINCTEH